MSIDAERQTGGPTPTEAAPMRTGRRGLPLWPAVIVGVILLDILAFFVIPPYPPGSPGQPVTGIPDLIQANFELPAPHVVWDLAPASPVDPAAIVFFHPSITATILTTWIVMVIVLLIVILSTRGMGLRPGRAQNAIETVYELLSDFATSLGGSTARRYVPLFAGIFLFVLFSNWFGLLPVTGRVEFLRAPTSDVNVTLGMALVSFIIFESEGIRRLGVRGYFGKFFSLRAFKEGIGPGLISLYVGLIEFTLEFIKPITLALRLFGNIFGGETALGVITALTIAVVPFVLLGLEVLLNFVQALIFSVLTLMYTLIAIESHDEEAHAAPAFEGHSEAGSGTPVPGREQPVPAH